MQPILDRPVVSLQLKQAARASLGSGEAGDEISDLDADLVTDPACAFDACNLGGARPIQVRHDLGADRDLARLEPAVTLVCGLCLCQIRRQSGFFRAGLGRGKNRRNSRRCQT